MMGLQFRRGVHAGFLGDDGVAFAVAGAGRVPHNGGTVFLMGLAPGHGAGNQVHAGVLAGQGDLKVRPGDLLLFGEQPLPNQQFGVFAHLAPGDSLGAVHAADLRGVHFQHGILVQIGLRHRVDGAQAEALAQAHVLFQILHPGTLAQEKPVNAVVPGGFAVRGVHAAAGHDDHVRPRADEEIVVHQIVHVAVGHAGGNADAFAHRTGIHPDVQAGLVLFGSNMNVIGGHAPRAEAVLPNVVRAAEFSGEVGNLAQNLPRNLVHSNTASCFTQFSAMGEQASRSPITSEAPPWRETLPPATTAISSAIFKIRS